MANLRNSRKKSRIRHTRQRSKRAGMRQNGGVGILSGFKGKTHEAKAEPGFVSGLKDQLFKNNRTHRNSGTRMFHKHMAEAGLDNKGLDKGARATAYNQAMQNFAKEVIGNLYEKLSNDDNSNYLTYQQIRNMKLAVIMSLAEDEAKYRFMRDLRDTDTKSAMYMFIDKLKSMTDVHVEGHNKDTFIENIIDIHNLDKFLIFLQEKIIDHPDIISVLKGFINNEKNMLEIELTNARKKADENEKKGKATDAQIKLLTALREEEQGEKKQEALREEEHEGVAAETRPRTSASDVPPSAPTGEYDPNKGGKKKSKKRKSRKIKRKTKKH